MCERRFQLLQRFHFDLNRHARIERQRGVHRRADSVRRRDVILLDQDAVVEREPLVVATADAYRVLLREPQAGKRLPRVEYARARALDRIDETARRASHARQQLQEVEAVALGGQKRARRAMQQHDRRVSRHPVPLAILPLDADRGIDAPHHLVEPRHAAQHRFLTDRNARGAPDVGGNETPGLIAAADILGQRVFHVARERRIERLSVLRANFREQRRQEFVRSRRHHAAPTFENSALSFAKSPLACTRFL